MDQGTGLDAWRSHVRRLTALRGAQALLSWDQQTGMPPAASGVRAEQLALLGELQHQWKTDPAVYGYLESLEKSQDERQIRIAEVARRSVDRAQKLPARLVREMSSAQSDAFGAWVEAKEADDFATFAPKLDRVLALTREQLALIDPSRHPYDVSLEMYDPGTTIASLRPMFSRLRTGLVELLEAIGGAETIPETRIAAPVSAQRALNQAVSQAMGYDFEAGRIDEAAHPFTIDIGREDVRITTAYQAEDVLVALGATTHEVGHALYEQGLPGGDLKFTGLDSAASMGMHESQSRFWENSICRSSAFCEWVAPLMREHLGDAAPSAEHLYQQSNRVEPGLIRIFADEVTYNLHIIVRFELELQLIEGTLSVADLPEAWNAAYRDTLGVEVPDMRSGVLQDVHWSSGAFGYFPSYTLGNLYAAALEHTLVAQRPGLWDEVREGVFGPTLSWLRHNVHQRGSELDAPDIVRAVCGDVDLVEALLSRLWARHGALYEVSR